MFPEGSLNVWGAEKAERGSGVGDDIFEALVESAECSVYIRLRFRMEIEL